MPSLYATTVASPIGTLHVAATDVGLCLIAFDDGGVKADVESLARRYDVTRRDGTNVHLDRATKELAAYFSGTLRDFSVSLDVRGTDFQQAVWHGLKGIRYGQTISYGELARRIGRPGASRAVGAANGANRMAVVLPCHRVVNAVGALHGYGGGLWRKGFLLQHEQAIVGRTAHIRTA
jgi:AraC family transcriptional regulator of adaptative response/methylated-DNA-[protein]-cysteine methyltransferase